MAHCSYKPAVQARINGHYSTRVPKALFDSVGYL